MPEMGHFRLKILFNIYSSQFSYLTLNRFTQRVKNHKKKSNKSRFRVKYDLFQLDYFLLESLNKLNKTHILLNNLIIISLRVESQF